MVHALASLRKLQYMSSSFSTCIFTQRGLLLCQMVLFIFGFISTVIGRFYFWERHNLYGCRHNYEEGFPVICPLSKRPTFIDLDTAFCYGLSFVSVVFMIVIPMIWTNYHWRCNLRSEIMHFSDKAFSKNNIIDEEAKWRVQKTLLCLEHASTYCKKRECKTAPPQPVEHHKFIIHLGSCIWSELFLLYQFKRWKSFALLICGITVIIALPCLMNVSSQGWNGTLMIFGMFLFLVSPFFSGLLLLVLMSCMVSINNPHLIALGIFLGWCLLTCVIIWYSFWREGHDELALMRYCFKRFLPLYMSDVKGDDIDVLLYLRGYGEYQAHYTDT